MSKHFKVIPGMNINFYGFLAFYTHHLLWNLRIPPAASPPDLQDAQLLIKSFEF